MRPSDPLKAHHAELRQFVIRIGTLHLRVFGSVITGTGGEDSDFDLLVGRRR